jgi:hypothetical protein
MSHKFKFTTIFLVLFVRWANAQISVNFPMDKAVFQRNSNNQANINIAGIFTSATTSIEARLLNPLNGNSIVVDWTVIQANPLGGVFYGTISNVNGGWYTLEVRAKSGATVIGTTSVNRVGVGEVFIIAGQSNAQGLENYGSVSSTDERVVNHNWSGQIVNGQCSTQIPIYPTFSQLQSNNNIATWGQSSWCWGKLGDLLVSNLGVPVVFFNTAVAGTTTRNWRVSSDNQSTTNIYTGNPFCNGVIGPPYRNLKNALNYYASIFGVRAVLWHQGESDADPRNGEYNGGRPSTQDYYDNLSYIINKSRTDFGNSNLPWVVSRVSYIGVGTQTPTTYQPVIDAQNNAIASINKVFSGPNTDNLTNRFFDGDFVHFSGSQLIDLANAWYSELNSSFFSNATPTTAKTLPIITVNCIAGNQLQFTAPSGYSSYKWVRTDTGNNDFESTAEATSQSITRSSGDYRCYMTDAQGNIVVSQTVKAVFSSSICPSCATTTFLSDILESSSSNGIGNFKKDLSHSGATITLNGKTYSKGLGVHTNSEIIYNLNGLYGRFVSDIGIDDAITPADCGGQGGTAIFQVYRDDVLAYQSPILNRNSPILNLNINVSGVTQLRIKVTDAGDNNWCDHGDWAGARLYCPDNTAPSTPTNLTGSNLTTKCVTLNWGASNDNVEVAQYKIYRNGSLIDSVASNILSYSITNLQANNTYTYEVRAEDYSKNLSSPAIVNINTTQNLVVYSNKCVGVSSIPTINIAGGTFSLLTVGATLNSTTGELSTNTAGVYQVKYKIGSGICADSVIVSVTFSNPPTPSILANKTILNQGQSVTLTSNNCAGTVTWTGGQTTTSITINPSSSQAYQLTCSVNGCTGSASIIIFVLSPCENAYSISSPSFNLNGAANDLTVRASQTITVSNLLLNQAKLSLKAGKSITIQPGFFAESNTVFRAEIEGCTVSGVRRRTDSSTIINPFVVESAILPKIELNPK